MPFIELNTVRKTLLATIGVTLSLAPIIILVTLFLGEAFNSLRHIGLGIWIFTSTRVNVLITLSLVLAILPYTLVDYFNRKYVGVIDKALPDFFKGMAEAIRSGMTFLEALRHVSLTIGGPLGNEIKRALVRVELGDSVEASLENITSRIRLPALQRAVMILRTAYESGGRVIDVLESSAEIYGRLRTFEEEKSVVINPHSVTIYVATFVYLFLIFVLYNAFILPLGKLSGIARFVGGLDPAVYKAIFYYSSAIEAIFGGLIVGKMRHGKISGGLIHVIIQLTIVMVFFLVIDYFGEHMVIIPLR